MSRNIRRIFHPVRSIPPPRSRRSNQQLSNAMSSSLAGTSTTNGTTFSSARDNIDPIAELLSQLSGVRRAAQQQNVSSTASQLQLLQQQLQFERQQVCPSSIMKKFYCLKKILQLFQPIESLAFTPNAV